MEKNFRKILGFKKKKIKFFLIKFFLNLIFNIYFFQFLNLILFLTERRNDIYIEMRRTLAIRTFTYISIGQLNDHGWLYCLIIFCS